MARVKDMLNVKFMLKLVYVRVRHKPTVNPNTNLAVALAIAIILILKRNIIFSLNLIRKP